MASSGHSPLDQFQIKPIKAFEAFGYDISITNSSLFMILSTLIALSYLIYATRKKAIIPCRWQSSVENIYSFIRQMLIDNTGEAGLKFFPLALSLFIFILFANISGMLPYSFTSTSHIIVTFALSAALFIIIIIAAFLKHGIKFLSIFMPSGVPLWLAPLLILIELFAYLARPVSLSIRLAANMTAGHTMMKVIAGFIVSLGIVGGWLPLIFLILLTGFEIFIAILQAYIFTMLACVYLNDAVNMDH